MAELGSAVDALLAESDALLRSINAIKAVVRSTTDSDGFSEEVQADRCQSSIASSPCTRGRKKRSRNTTRDREKAEIAFLRKHVVQLEGVLAARSREQSRSINVEAQVVVSAAWERLASRHLRMRRASEKENRQLRSSIESNATSIRAIWQMMQSRALATERKCFVGSHLLRPLGDHSTMIDQLKNDVQRAYAQTDDILASRGLRSGEALLDHFSKSHRDVGTVGVTFAQAFPFSVEQVSSAIWRVMTAWLSSNSQGITFILNSSHPIELKPVEKNETICAGRGHCQSTIEGVHMQLSYYGVFQRYIEVDGKSVFVWEVLLSAEPSEPNSHVKYEVKTVSWIVVNGVVGLHTAARVAIVTDISEDIITSDSGHDKSVMAAYDHRKIMDELVKAKEICLTELIQQLDKILLRHATPGGNPDISLLPSPHANLLPHRALYTVQCILVTPMDWWHEDSEILNAATYMSRLEVVRNLQYARQYTSLL
ncbi:hypothetical protein FI667_g17690, partial [Globisporangium splendens]